MIATAPRKKRRGPSAFAPAVGVKSNAQNAPSTTTASPPSSLPAPGLTRPSGRNTSLKRALVHFLSGGMSAGLVRASLQPLDTCKTRLQASSVAAPLRTTLLANKGVRGLYRGVVPGVVGIVPAAAVYMLVFQSLKTRLTARFPDRGRNVAIAASAAIGDVVASLVRVPCEVLKQRLQVGVYSDLGGALRGLVASRQLGRLYAGLGAQLARDVPYAAVEFVFYENLKNGVSDGKGEKLSRAESFVVGGVSGAAAAIASNPLDVVKTRLMTQTRTGGGVKYKGVGHALVTVAREEGVKTFAKGIAPRIAAKTLQSALFFAAYETIKKHIAQVVGVEMKAKGG